MSDGTSALYDALAPHYRQYSASRQRYLDAVDREVLARIPVGAGSLLDIGSGDGVRALSLARRAGIATVVLSDVSAAMVQRCRALRPTAVWHAAAEELPDSDRRFDVITCLWNVLGHVEERAGRRRALARMRALLQPGGRLFLDVNNRYNAAAYGWLRVFWRLVIDSGWPDDSRGDARFEWRIDGRSFPARGRLFRPAEAERLFAAGGFRVCERLAIDYRTGRVSRSPLRGQFLFVLAR